MKQLQSIPQGILLCLAIGRPLLAAACMAPQPPFVPADPALVSEYSELIWRDFEDYIQHIQRYLRFLEEERRRAFEEAKTVSQAYGVFLESSARD